MGTNGSCAGDSPHEPTAPGLELEHHYGSETGCDVVFLVGPTQETCLRIPAHSHILKNATPVFGAMFSQSFFSEQSSSQGGTDSGSKQIGVPDLDGKAFDNLMKYGQR